MTDPDQVLDSLLPAELAAEIRDCERRAKGLRVLLRAARARRRGDVEQTDAKQLTTPPTGSGATHE